MRSVRSPQSGRSGGRLAARAPFGWKVGWASPAAACAGGAEYICGAACAGAGPPADLGIGPEDDRAMGPEDDRAMGPEDDRAIGPEDDRAIGPEDDRAIGPELAPFVPAGAGRP